MSAPQAPADTEAYEMLRRHGSHSSAFLAMNSGNRRFRTDGVDGFVPYREAGRRHLFQLGGPVCAVEDQPRLLTALLARAGSERRRVAAVQLSRAQAELHAGHGFVVNQFGASFSIALDGYSLGGQRMVKVRNMVNRARRKEFRSPRCPPRCGTARRSPRPSTRWTPPGCARRAGTSRNSSS